MEYDGVLFRVYLWYFTQNVLFPKSIYTFCKSTPGDVFDFFGATHPSQTFFTVSLMINHLMGPTGAAPSLGVVVPIPEGTLSR